MSGNDTSFLRGSSTHVVNVYLASEQKMLKAVKLPSQDESLPSVHLRKDEVQAATLARKSSIF